jgi:tRNA-dihydrouridine synthase
MEVFKTILDHATRLIVLKGEKTGITEMRGHVAHYLKGFPDARQFKVQLVRINNLSELQDILGEYRKYLDTL